MELKPDYYDELKAAEQASNCTNMELKLTSSVWGGTTEPLLIAPIWNWNDAYTNFTLLKRGF